MIYVYIDLRCFASVREVPSGKQHGKLQAVLQSISERFIERKCYITDIGAVLCLLPRKTYVSDATMTIATGYSPFDNQMKLDISTYEDLRNDINLV